MWLREANQLRLPGVEHALRSKDMEKPGGRNTGLFSSTESLHGGDIRQTGCAPLRSDKYFSATLSSEIDKHRKARAGFPAKVMRVAKNVQGDRKTFVGSLSFSSHFLHRRGVERQTRIDVVCLNHSQSDQASSEHPTSLRASLAVASSIED
jgi:hypothetical protein